MIKICCILHDAIKVIKFTAWFLGAVNFTDSKSNKVWMRYSNYMQILQFCLHRYYDIIKGTVENLFAFLVCSASKANRYRMGIKFFLEKENKRYWYKKVTISRQTLLHIFSLTSFYLSMCDHIVVSSNVKRRVMIFLNEIQVCCIIQKL